MGKNQGIIRFKNSFIRTLTKHEVARGYVFISRDQKMSTLVDVDSFDVDFLGTLYESRKLDKYGRILISRLYLKTIGTETLLKFEIPSNKLMIISKAE